MAPRSATALLLWFSLLFAPALLADEVVLQNGITIKCRVTARDSSKVVVLVNGRAMTYKAADVAEIKLDPLPEFDEGTRLLAEGNISGAISAFEKVLHGERTLFQQEARARLICCYFQTNRPEDGLSTFLEMLRQTPDSPYVLSFPWQHGFKLRDPSALLSLVARHASAVPIAPALKAWILLASGKSAEGQSEVSSLTVSRDIALKELGIILQLRLLFEAKKYDECIKLTDEKMTALRDPARAWAYYWRGRCYFEKGDYTRAALDQLRVGTLYRASGPLAGDSLYWAGQCFEKMGRNDRAKREYTDAAVHFPAAVSAALARGRAAAIK